MTVKRKTGAEAAEQLTDFLNSAGEKECEEFIQTITNDHRFLQQEAFTLFMGCINQWSLHLQNGRYDERNEHACKTSRRIEDSIYGK
jgi:hypothetical protein